MIGAKYGKNYELRSNYKEFIMTKKARKYGYEFSSRELIFLVISFICIATLIFALGFKIGQGWQLTLSSSLLTKADKVNKKGDNPQQLTAVAKAEADRPKVESQKAQEDLTFFEILPNKGKLKLEDIKPQITPEYAPIYPASASKTNGSKEKEKEKERIVEKKKENVDALKPSTNLKDSIHLGEEKTYTIQVSSFKDKAQAQNLEARLRKKGFPVKLVSVEMKDSGLWHRVRVGSYKERKEAERVAEQLRAQENVPTFIAFLYTN